MNKRRSTKLPSRHPSLSTLGCALLFVLLSASASPAASLDKYREQVRLATVVLDALPQWKKVESQSDYTRRETAAVKALRENVLTIETVEWNGASITLDNKWLVEGLARYEQLPAADQEQRANELAYIRQRFQALNEHLEAVVGAVRGTSKEEEKKRLDDILRRAEYNDTADAETTLARLWRRFREWLRSLMPERSPLAPGTASTLSGVSQIIVIALALAVIVFVLWKFTPMFRRSREGRKHQRREARIVLGERLEPDQTSADLLAEAEALARRGELRAAIRKGYIALLCELGDRKLIGLAEHKTNRDYLSAVRQIEPLHGHLQQLTSSFENHWYGFVPATESDWQAFRSGFRRITNNE